MEYEINFIFEQPLIDFHVSTVHKNAFLSLGRHNFWSIIRYTSYLS